MTSARIPRRDTPGELSWAETPLTMLRRAFLGFLQQLYSYAEKGGYRWDQNLQVTELVITDESPINLEVVAQRPAITTLRGPVGYAGLTLGTRQNHDMMCPKKNYTDLASTTLTLNHLASDDIPSEYLASVTARHLWWLKGMLKRGTPIHEIQQPQVGSPSPAGTLVQGDTRGKWRNTTVTVPVFFQDYGTVEGTDQPILNGVDVSPSYVSRALGHTPVRDLFRDGAPMAQRVSQPAPTTRSEDTIKVR